MFVAKAPLAGRETVPSLHQAHNQLLVRNGRVASAFGKLFWVQGASRWPATERLHYRSSRMADVRINPTDVMAAILDPKHRGHVIWSPSTTLEKMGIEWYPHMPRSNYRRMKQVLKKLCADGQLVQRACLHSHFTFKEIAYERPARSGVAGDPP